MLRRPFGPTRLDVPVIGQGTWQFRDTKRAGVALQAGIDLGMTHIDTAELYTGSEECIRPVIAHRRDDVFLVSKVLPRNASYKGTLAACEASLLRLGTDHLDVYLLHWWSDEHPIEDTIRAMGELVDAGRTRLVGVSNLDVDELEQARAALGPRKLACDQVLYHLKDRGMESDVLPWCRRHGVAVVGYSPFGSRAGFPSPTSKGGRVLAEIGAQLGKTPRQVALAFLTRDDVVFAIPKAEDPDHTRENAGGAFRLSRDAVERIDGAFPMRPGLGFL